MQGINFVVDEQGNKSAVQIDLNVYGELWEDIHDLLLIHQRRDEPRDSLSEIKSEMT